MASLLSSSAATAAAAGAVLLPVVHPTSRSGAGGRRLLSSSAATAAAVAAVLQPVGRRLLSFAAPEDTKVSGLVPVISRGSGLLALAVPEGATGGWGLLPASTRNNSRGNGDLVALAMPEGATGLLAPANTNDSSRGIIRLVVLAVPEGAMDLLPSNTMEAWRAIVNLDALAVQEGAMDLLPSNTMEAWRAIVNLDALAVQEGAMDLLPSKASRAIISLDTLAVTEGATGVSVFLHANTTTGSRLDGLVALPLPVGSTGGCSLLPASTTNTSGGDVLALALPASGWGARHGSGSSRTTETSHGSGVVGLAVPEGATGGRGFLKANTTYSSRGDALALAVPARGWGILPTNAASSSRWDGVVARALPQEGANRWSGCGPLPEGAPAEDVKSFYAQEFAKSVEEIGTINTYAVFGHPDILEVAAEAAERCIHVVELVLPIVVNEFAGHRPPHLVIESTTALSVRIVKDCKFVIAECSEGYVRERPLLDALHNFKVPAAGFIRDMGLGPVPAPPKPFISVISSPTEAEKVAYFRGLAEDFNKLTRIVESRVNKWIDSGKSTGWYEWSLISAMDD